MLVGHHSGASGERQTIHRPGIAPLAPLLQPLRRSDGVTQSQPRHRKQLGEAADHHQVGVFGYERYQRVPFTLRHQGQESFIADHQAMTSQERLQGRAAPELPCGVVGIGDPKHLSLGVLIHQHRPRLGPLAGPAQVHRQALNSTTPTGQGPAIVRKAWFQQATHTTRRSITGRPGEQLGSAIARQHRVSINPMPGRDGPSQLLLAAVWIITQGTTTDASFQSPKQKRRRPKRNQGGAGIQQLPGPQAHPSGFLTEIAAMGRWSGAQSDCRIHRSILPSKPRRRVQTPIQPGSSLSPRDASIHLPTSLGTLGPDAGHRVDGECGSTRQ